MANDLNGLLGSNEKIVFETRQHWWMLVRDAGLLIVLSLLFIGAYAWVTSKWDNSFSKYLGYALLIALVVVVAKGLWKLIGWSSERLYLTTSKLIYRHGVFNKQVTSTPLVKIDEIVLTQPFFGRMLGYGRLEVENAAGGKEPLAGLEFIPRPAALYQMITERARSQRMVEGGSGHRDEDNDGIVDSEQRDREPSGSERGDGWTPPGESTTGR